MAQEFNLPVATQSAGKAPSAGKASTAAIETRGLTRRYGKLTAVDNLNLQVPAGSIYGLIGPNGAGKTTTLRMLAGLLEPSAGQILVNGQLVNHNWRDLQRLIGYMPDFFGVYEDLLVWEYLDFFARCYNLAPARRKQVVDELLELVDLAEKRDSYVETLSRGMRQRLCLAHALVHDPQVLLLDEPASGLDPRARVEMRELLRELGAMGKTIILSSHILSELAELCDSIGIIERGQLVASGSLEGIQTQLQAERTLRIRVLSSLEDAQAALSNRPGVGRFYVVGNGAENGAGAASAAGSEAALPDEPGAERGAESLEDAAASAGPGLLQVEFLGDEAAAADLLAALVAQGVRVASFSEVSTGLEEVFLRLTKGEVA